MEGRGGIALASSPAYENDGASRPVARGGGIVDPEVEKRTVATTIEGTNSKNENAEAASYEGTMLEMPRKGLLLRIAMAGTIGEGEEEEGTADRSVVGGGGPRNRYCWRRSRRRSRTTRTSTSSA